MDTAATSARTPEPAPAPAALLAFSPAEPAPPTPTSSPATPAHASRGPSSDGYRAVSRRLPVGAEVVDGGGVHFRVWAPDHDHVAVVLEPGETVPLDPQGEGYFAGRAPSARPGMRYRYRVGENRLLADPASRFQPEGPHGPSMVVDPLAFGWTDAAWPGVTLHGQVIYELHVGTFTPEGTWAAAQRQLPALAELGVTLIEVMPIADFPGRFGWGYDGVCWFAPTRLYGTPDDVRRFVDRAHALQLGVILDVVYNHFGPDGCVLHDYAAAYFSSRHKSEWGDSPNFDDVGSGPVRELVLANAAYWVDEFHFDGLRLDATQAILDDSRPHILDELGERVRAAAPHRRVLIVNENEPQDARLVRPTAAGGRGLDMIWNDDWHHSAHVAASSQDEAYFTDYLARPQEFVSAAKHGFLFQGQWYRWQSQRRGVPSLDLAPARLVHFLENHDQVANSGTGERLHTHTSPARWRALTALLLLGPQTPMLFQGQEFASSAPFQFFADHGPELARLVQRGRHEFMAQFAQFAAARAAARLPTPQDTSTFERCRLDHTERQRGHHRRVWLMHRDLLRLRREDRVLQRAHRSARARDVLDGAVLGEAAFVLRFFGEDDEGDRLLVVNLGRVLHLDRAPEPLLAPLTPAGWRVAWSSQDPLYGGIGTLLPEAAQQDRRVPSRVLPRPFDNWRLQGEAAMLLVPGTERS